MCGIRVVLNQEMLFHMESDIITYLNLFRYFLSTYVHLDGLSYK